MPDYRRRKEDPLDPEASIIRKAVRSGLLDKIIYAVVAAVLGGTASVATHSVADADSLTTIQTNRAEILAIRQELNESKKALWGTTGKKDEEHDRQLRTLERRVTWLEAKTGIYAPPAPAAEAAPPRERP